MIDLEPPDELDAVRELSVSRAVLEGVGDDGPPPTGLVAEAQALRRVAATAGTTWRAEPGDLRRIDFWSGAGALLVHAFAAAADQPAPGSLSEGVLAATLLARTITLDHATVAAAGHAPGPAPALPAVADAPSLVAAGDLGPDARLRWVAWERAGEPGGFVVLHVSGWSRWAPLGGTGTSAWSDGGLDGLAVLVAGLYRATELT